MYKIVSQRMHGKFCILTDDQGCEHVVPIVSGGTGQNGAIVLLKVNTEDSANDFQFVGGQTSLSLSDTTAEIDISDKLSGRLGERTPGRATAGVSLELNFLRSDPVIAFLRSKYRNRQSIEVMVFDRDNLDAIDSVGEIVGTDIESCTGIITDFSEEHPDQEKSVVSLEINLNNDWAAAA